MSQMVKPEKVPTWSHDISLETFVRQLQIWQSSNRDVPVNSQYEDFVESLKISKDVNVLAKYVGKHILPVLNTQEH